MKNKKYILILSVVTLAFLTVGCATMEGAGKDLEKLGEEIQQAADK